VELRHLEHFVAVAEEGHFTRAASRCHISQSALSTSIRALERELGSPLFIRTTRNVELTAAGRVLLGEAARTLAAATSARDSVLAVQGVLRGWLRAGGIPTPGLLDQAALLAAFRDLHPAVDIRYLRDTSMALVPEVEASRLDVAFVSLPQRLPEPVLAIPLVSQRLMFVCRPDHRLAGRKRIALRSLAGEDFVGPPNGSASYEAVDRVFTSAAHERRVPFEVNDTLTILDFVAHGLGVTLAPEYLATSRPDLRAIRLTNPDMTWTLAAIVHRHHATPAAQAFMTLLPEPDVPQLRRPSRPRCAVPSGHDSHHLSRIFAVWEPAAYGRVAGMSDYVTVNRASWDERAPAHAASSDYAVDRFTSDPRYLSGVVRFDRPRLGDLTGLRGVHLQCHIGTDTVSLSRLGARMSGLDFSPAALAEARRLATSSGSDIDFRDAEVYDAVDVFGAGTFDLVYTGVGALCWLPDAARWARVVARLLRPGGRLFIREGHPMLWSIDEKSEQLSVRYPYFEHAEPLVFDDPGTYVQTDTAFVNTVSHSWNHGLGEIITGLLEADMRLTGFAEHDSVPWEALPGQMTVDDVGEWRLADRPERLAASYTLQAVKE
jgi:DNA-binding transcriptional LysR family regulator/SAM-dependent methyltransferase